MSIPSPFAAVDTNFDRSTEYALKLKSTAGYVALTYGPNFPGSAAATGLANDATAYTASISVDGVAKAISVVGSAAQTFADLITEINTDLAAAGTAALVGDSIVVTSATTGTASLVVVTDTDLFSSVSGTTFALTNTTTIKGADEYVRWAGLDRTTQDNVAYTINSFLAADVANTNTTWTSGSDALSFPTGAPTSATQTGLTLTTVYQLNVALDGGAGVELLINLPLYGTLNNLTFGHLLQAVNSALVAQSIPAVATFDEVSPLTLRITSNSVGAASAVVITDGAANGLIAALAAFGAGETAATPGYQVVNVGGDKVGATASGLANDATAYTASISVDGVAKAISIVGSAAQTFTTVLSEINTDLGASAVASLVGGNIVVASATSGSTSTVAITDTDLFSTLAGFAAILPAVAGVNSPTAAVAGVDGTTNVTFPVTKASRAWDDWSEVLNNWSSLLGTNYGPLYTSGDSAHIRKETKPASKGVSVNTYVYWNGAAWKFYDDDATVGAVVNPPEL